MFFRLLILGLISNFSIYGNDCDDTKEVIHERVQQYNSGGFDKFIITAPWRTGSTLVYNIFRYLFEEEKNFKSPGWIVNKNIVSKRDHFPDDGFFKNLNSVFIVTKRNPLDSIYSLCKVICPTKINEKYIEQRIKDYLFLFDKAKRLESQGFNVLVLKYESFVNDFDYLFNEIEKYFDIEIFNEDKINIIECFSKESVISHIKKYHHFGKWDTETGFHGKHINLEKNEDVDLKNLIRRVLIKYKRELEALGYFL